MPASITSLPPDLFRCVARHSTLEGIGRLRRACRSWNNALDSDHFWTDLIRRDFPWHLPTDGSAPERPRENYAGYLAGKWNDVGFLLKLANDASNRDKSLDDLTYDFMTGSGRTWTPKTLAEFLVCFGCIRRGWTKARITIYNRDTNRDTIAQSMKEALVKHAGEIWKEKTYYTDNMDDNAKKQIERIHAIQIARGEEPERGQFRVTFEGGFEVIFAWNSRMYGEGMGTLVGSTPDVKEDYCWAFVSRDFLHR